MLRLERSAGALTVVSRLARPRVLAVLGVAIGGSGLAVAGAAPRVAAALGLAAALVVVLGGRAVRATFARGRVRIRPAAPFLPGGGERALGAFVRASIETVGEDRARRADRLAERFHARSGAELPGWMRARPTPGMNDHLRRVVLVARDGERVAVTAWLAPDDALEPLLAELDALLGGA